MTQGKISRLKKAGGAFLGSITGPAVAITEGFVFQFDLPIKETITNKQDFKPLVLLNALVMTGLFNPMLTVNNIIHYFNAAVEAGKEGGPSAVLDSFEFLQLPVGSFFKPTLEGMAQRCLATELDINNHARRGP